jgi:hypothetical protein
MEAVDRLHGGRRILERAGRDRPLGDVDEHADAVGDILVERPLRAERDRAHDVRGVQGSGRAGDADQRASLRHEVAHAPQQFQAAVRLLASATSRS